MDVLSAAIMLFLIMDPLGNLPIFVSVLKSVPEERRTRVLVRELLLAYGIMVGFLFAGRSVLSFLHLRQESVSISGGIILFIIAIRMIFPRPGRSEEVPDGEPFIVPLAIPMVAGPSVLAALLLLTSSGTGTYVHWLGALTGAWLVSAVILLMSNTVYRVLGKRGLIAMERLMGMVLVMLSVQMFLDGVIAYMGR
ncbi:MAG: YhgN family NAAT transporter [Pseudomonadota bacterium]